MMSLSSSLTEAAEEVADPFLLFPFAAAAVFGTLTSQGRSAVSPLW
jgi:hypothetical protein